MKNCPICGGLPAGYVEHCDDYELSRCGDCELVYSTPMKGGDEEFYQGHLVYENFSETEALKQLSSFNNMRNRGLWRRLPAGARILDIGCGYGAFTALSVARGFDAWGIDFNMHQIETGRAAYGLEDRLKVGRLESLTDLGLPMSYDMITMFEVIEHVENPRGVLELVDRLLKPDGILVLSCPNEARWMPAGRIFVDYPPHHLTRWSPKALTRAVQSIGYSDCKFEIDASFRDLLWTAYVNFSASRKMASSDIDRKSKNPGKLFNWKRMLYDISIMFIYPFDVFLKMFNVGTMGMRMTARKNTR